MQCNINSVPDVRDAGFGDHIRIVEAGYDEALEFTGKDHVKIPMNQ